ncbi:N-acetylmuramyl-L-alanine amidase, negative regulator of AmpC, AmpD [Niastella koreensis GR20-10]|uniref:N-acetylmuramoyl-L-alanine amidase n=2 Tax=Niastella koreensis TaxID=354356 RepID=G8T8S0_NIAKG|nr:N-acetylmuramyl-L-alanine amidase, negative regulator of AmpC, AmpD [Niastella koreensis GR20-10]
MMSTRRLLTGLFLILLFRVEVMAQTDNYKAWFAEAYQQYPNIPQGVLESTAWSASRLNNMNPQAPGSNEVTMPLRFGIFGLVEDGKGYFKNNLLTVTALSGITTEQFKNDVRLQIMAVAKFLSKEASQQQPGVRLTAESFAPVLEKLAEIPDDGTAVNTYAHSLYTYDVYNHLKKGFSSGKLQQLPRSIQLDRIYAPTLLRTLSAPGVSVDYLKGRIKANGIILPTVNKPASGSTARVETTNDAAAVQSTDYPPALWDQASTSNFTVGRGSAITNVVIHTCEGSYAGTISWFNNASAQVSAHYVIRSSDGQITQMVLEKDRAWHVLSANDYTIGIEHEGYVASGNTWYTNAMYTSSAALVRDICADRNIDGTTCFRGPATSGTNFLPVTVRIKGHQHYSGNTHTDPGIYWNWSKYADLINPPTAVTVASFAVKDQSTGLAIASAAVIITKPDGTTASATTNASGQLIYGLDSGKYTFAFSKSGYKNISTFFYGGPNDSVYADINLDVAGTARIATNTTPLLTANPNQMVLTGYVRDGEQNSALSGAIVRAGNHTATTDGRGFFTLTVPSNAITPGQTPATISIQSNKAGYITHSIQHFYAIPDTYEMQIALTPTTSFTSTPLPGLEELVVRHHGLFDKTLAEQIAFTGSHAQPIAGARQESTVVAAAALAVPAVIRVATSCACTACTNPHVQVMSLESYVQTGVDDEWVSSWNAASLQAGTVAYRSRGAWFVQNPIANNYDISAAACHQTWQTDRATSVKNAAIATAGIVLVKNGAIYKAEYCAESNNAGCGDGFSGTGTDYPCISDARCVGRTKSGAGRGMCQWGSSFWGTDQNYTWILNHYYNPDSAAIQTAAGTLVSSNTTDSKTTDDHTLTIAPNPVTGGTITVEYTLADVSQPASIVLSDNFGQSAQQRNVVLQQGINRISVNTNRLKAGIYNVSIRLVNGKTISKKILIVK